MLLREDFHTRKNDTSNKNCERCLFRCENSGTSNQKPQRFVSFAPKFPPYICSCSLQRRFADIQRETFFSNSFSRNKSKKHLGNWSGIVSCISQSMKRIVESQLNNGGRGKTERDVSLSCAFYRSYFVFYLSLTYKLQLIQIGHLN